MRAAANHGTLLEALAALAPCPWLYSDIGQDITRRGATPGLDHPFKDWIDEYADPIFVKYTNELLGYLERYAERTTDESEKARAVELFCLSARYETLFWDQAWTQQQWPDDNAGARGLSESIDKQVTQR
jgi:thiaminase/transcriptional activator TenA